MFSNRFKRNIRVMFHARQRMTEQSITEPLLLDLIETGTVRYKDEKRIWIFKATPLKVLVQGIDFTDVNFAALRKFSS